MCVSLKSLLMLNLVQLPPVCVIGYHLAKFLEISVITSLPNEIYKECTRIFFRGCIKLMKLLFVICYKTRNVCTEQSGSHMDLEANCLLKDLVYNSQINLLQYLDATRHFAE